MCSSDLQFAQFIESCDCTRGWTNWSNFMIQSYGKDLSMKKKSTRNHEGVDCRTPLQVQSVDHSYEYPNFLFVCLEFFGCCYLLIKFIKCS